MINNITKPEIEELVRLLKKLEPGYYPIEVFWEFCRLVKVCTVELVPFVRDQEGNIKVVLTKRDDNDKFWPGMYHTPGCIVRPRDTLEESINRVMIEELKNPKVLKPPKFVTFLFSGHKRGEGVQLLYWVELDKKIPCGELFSCDELPVNFIQGQKKFLDKALEDYNQFYARN